MTEFGYFEKISPSTFELRMGADDRLRAAIENECFYTLIPQVAVDMHGQDKCVCICLNICVSLELSIHAYVPVGVCLWSTFVSTHSV